MPYPDGLHPGVYRITSSSDHFLGISSDAGGQSSVPVLADSDWVNLWEVMPNSSKPDHYQIHNQQYLYTVVEKDTVTATYDSNPAYEEWIIKYHDELGGWVIGLGSSGLYHVWTVASDGLIKARPGEITAPNKDQVFKFKRVGRKNAEAHT